jgi:hypothetical protein
VLLQIIFHALRLAHEHAVGRRIIGQHRLPSNIIRSEHE